MAAQRDDEEPDVDQELDSEPVRPTRSKVLGADATDYELPTWRRDLIATLYADTGA